MEKGNLGPQRNAALNVGCIKELNVPFISATCRHTELSKNKIPLYRYHRSGKRNLSLHNFISHEVNLPIRLRWSHLAEHRDMACLAITCNHVTQQVSTTVLSPPRPPTSPHFHQIRWQKISTSKSTAREVRDCVIIIRRGCCETRGRHRLISWSKGGG